MIHQRLAAYKSKPFGGTDTKLPVSIIICARNEYQNLQLNLPSILHQDYPDYEVILVNDCSSDDSDILLRQLSKEYPHLKVVTITEHQRFKHGKKFAVTLGIKASKNEHLLFTDADCKPASDQWISRMQSNFQNNKEIVLGYSPYEKLSGFVNLLIRFEAFLTALNYLSFALSGRPYMGVGRNMAYRKSLFFKGKGFASHMHILSGDDDLFVNQNATSRNTIIEIHPEAHVWSEPKKSLGAYFKQKLRHQGAGKQYKKGHKVMLSLQAGSAILFYITLITLICMQAQWWFLLALYLIRLIIQILTYYPILKKLNYADLIWWLPAFDFIYYFYMLTLGIFILFKKNIEWK
ncbi:glycosyltransferase [Flavihumibacter sp. R14]|nr:glycosyltransferase [Flavihumibacter soli]